MQDEVIIRRFKNEDVKGVNTMIHLSLDTAFIAKVYEPKVVDVWHTLYSEKYILGSSKIKHWYVAELNNEIVGSAAVNQDGNKAYVSAVYVNPYIQNKGIGKKLLTAIEQDDISQRLRILYVTASLSATNFYKKLGYKLGNEPLIIQDEGIEFIYLEKQL